MPDAVQIFNPGFRVLDTDGTPVSGAKIKFYDAGTSTPKTVYSDAALSTSLGSIVYTRSDGYPVASSGSSTTVHVYTGIAAYKVEITDSSDVSIFPSKDNVKGAVDTSTFVSTSTVTVNVSVVARTTDLTVTTTHKGKLINGNANGGTFTLTLDSALTLGDGWHVKLRNGGTSNPIKILTTSSQTVGRPEGTTTAFALSPGEGIEIACDGANFQMHGYTPPILNTAGVILIADRVTSAPVGPTSGARYIVTAGFSTYEAEDIIEADGQGSFFEITPPTDCGWLAYVQDEDIYYSFQASAWVALIRAASITAALGASMVLIQAQSASSSATIDFTTGLDDTYDEYELRISGMKAATDDVEVWARIGTGAGPTYQTSGYDFGFTANFVGSADDNGGTAQAKIILGTSTTATRALGNATGEKFDAVLRFANPDAAEQMIVSYVGGFTNSNGAATGFFGAGKYGTNAATTGIRIMCESGNIASGLFALYGIKKA